MNKEFRNTLICPLYKGSTPVPSSQVSDDHLAAPTIWYILPIEVLTVTAIHAFNIFLSYPPLTGLIL